MPTFPPFRPSPPTGAWLMPPTWSPYGAVSGPCRCSTPRATHHTTTVMPEQGRMHRQHRQHCLPLAGCWGYMGHITTMVHASPPFSCTSIRAHSALGHRCHTPHEADIPPSDHPHCCVIDAINAVPLWYHQWLSPAFNTRSCSRQWYPFPVSFLQHFLLLTSVNLAYDRSNSLYLDTSIELSSM